MPDVGLALFLLNINNGMVTHTGKRLACALRVRLVK